jgi:hypothetical protein
MFDLREAEKANKEEGYRKGLRCFLRKTISNSDAERKVGGRRESENRKDKIPKTESLKCRKWNSGRWTEHAAFEAPNPAPASHSPAERETNVREKGEAF